MGHRYGTGCMVKGDTISIIIIYGHFPITPL